MPFYTAASRKESLSDSISRSIYAHILFRQPIRAMQSSSSSPGRKQVYSSAKRKSRHLRKVALFVFVIKLCRFHALTRKRPSLRRRDGLYVMWLICQQNSSARRGEHYVEARFACISRHYIMKNMSKLIRRVIKSRAPLS